MNQYREGKAKRTPLRGVKQNLKPCTYKQWEPRYLIILGALCITFMFYKMNKVIFIWVIALILNKD